MVTCLGEQDSSCISLESGEKNNKNNRNQNQPSILQVIHTAVPDVAPEVLRTLISDITDQETSTFEEKKNSISRNL